MVNNKNINYFNYDVIIKFNIFIMVNNNKNINLYKII